MERRPAQARAADPHRAPTRAGSSSPGLVMAAATLGGDRRRRARRGRGARAHDGHDDVRDRQPVLLLHRARRAALGVQPRHVQRPHVPRPTSLLSVGAIILATELRFFQRILDTVELTGNQWLICIGAGLTVVVASEIWKFVLRHRHAAAMTPAAAKWLPIVGLAAALPAAMAARRCRRRHRGDRADRPEEPRLRGHRRRSAAERPVRRRGGRPDLRAVLHVAADLHRAEFVAGRRRRRGGAASRGSASRRPPSSSRRSRS